MFSRKNFYIQMLPDVDKVSCVVAKNVTDTMHVMSECLAGTKSLNYYEILSSVDINAGACM